MSVTLDRSTNAQVTRIAYALSALIDLPWSPDTIEKRS